MIKGMIALKSLLLFEAILENYNCCHLLTKWTGQSIKCDYDLTPSHRSDCKNVTMTNYYTTIPLTQKCKIN